MEVTLSDRFTVLAISVLYRGCAIPVGWKIVCSNEPGSWEPYWKELLSLLAEAVPADWLVIVLADRGLYAKWLYEHIVSLRWHPFLRINRTGKVRPAGESGFRWLSSVVPEMGMSWSGAVDCFAEATCGLPCTLLARWDEPYKEAWLIVTDLAPQQANMVWYSMRNWIEAGENRYQTRRMAVASNQDEGSRARRTLVGGDCRRDVMGGECGRAGGGDTDV